MMLRGLLRAAVATCQLTITLACATAQDATAQSATVPPATVQSAPAQPTEAQPSPATVAKIAESPGQYEGADLVVAGKLISEGNYFSRERKFFLIDDGNKRIEVTAWLPLSTPPGREDSSKSPSTMSDIIGSQVELRGGTRPPSGSSREWQFVVKSGRVVVQ